MYFQKAQPVWLADCTQEMNITGGFRTEITIQAEQPTTLTMAASTFYHVYLDGKPFMFGPTRCAHGFFRVDEWRLDERLLPGKHWLAVEVLGYHINGFDTLDQPVFLQLEVRQKETPVAWTDTAGTTVEAFRLRDRVQKVQRYDFQRSFAECYRLRADYGQWRCGGGRETVSALENAPGGTLLPRSLPPYTLSEAVPVKEIAVGTVTRAHEPWTFTRDRSVELVGTVLKGFREEEMELYVSKELEGFRCRLTALTGTAYDRTADLPVKDGAYRLFSMSCIKTGFLCLTVSCTKPVCVYALYDEVLLQGDILPYRQRAVNAIRLELEPGRYVFQSADPVDFKYLKIAALGGDCLISDIHLRELTCPLPIQKTYTGTDPALQDIYQAAVETFCQNSPDIFVDCPSRERGGWLCDSYFTAQTEYLLTGENRIEKLFLENFLLPAAFPDVPDGMLPMCYPADHYDHAFIPNWAMWFILELKNYLERTGDRTLIDRARERVYGIVEYFRPFLNEDGLLEKLEGWIFVEWSEAAELVQDVNYPTNMLYAAALMAVGELYDDAALRQQAERMRETIRRQSFNGDWFVDNAIRQEGKLVPGTKSTEVCQYYAFFFDVATPAQYPYLWERLQTQFVPNRDTAEVYPEIAPINVLPGVSLRLSLLDRYSCRKQLLQEIKERMTYMVKETGTLWENKKPEASCIHGFISFVSVLIEKNDPTIH